MSICIRKAPCEACPYRRDVPSGVWHPEEYDKLRLYDADTALQPSGAFRCHSTPEQYCHGWAMVHGPDELLSLRFARMRREWDGEVPESRGDLFASGNEAADHGQADVECPSEDAIRFTMRLLGKHERLRTAENIIPVREEA